MPETSLQSLASRIGRIGQLRSAEGLSFTVEIVDVKSAWGNVRYVVRSVTGDAATATVGAERVTVSEVAA
jgi:hypothetical protein